MLPGMELMSCPLAVPANVMHHVVKVESSFNPYAIGVVGGHLVRQPKSLDEALATVHMLEERGFNFSVGLAQVNRYNLTKYGLSSYQKAFEVCPNLLAGSKILAECHRSSGADWGKSFSCYYSGNFVTGFRHGYVQKIYASIGGAKPVSSRTSAIQVVSKPSRRAVASTSYPLYGHGDGDVSSAHGRVIESKKTSIRSSSDLLVNQVAKTSSLGAITANSIAQALPQSYGIAYPTNQPLETRSQTVAQQTSLSPQQAGGGDAAFVF